MADLGAGATQSFDDVSQDATTKGRSLNRRTFESPERHLNMQTSQEVLN